MVVFSRLSRGWQQFEALPLKKAVQLVINKIKGTLVPERKRLKNLKFGFNMKPSNSFSLNHLYFQFSK